MRHLQTEILFPFTPHLKATFGERKNMKEEAESPPSFLACLEGPITRFFALLLLME